MQDETFYRQLVSAGQDDTRPDESLLERTLQRSLEALPVCQSPATQDDRIGRAVPDGASDSAGGVQRRAHTYEGLPGRRLLLRRLVMAMHNRTVRWGGVAAVIAVVLIGGFSLWPQKPGEATSPGGWWLGPPAVWAGEINTAISAAAGKGVTWWERKWVVSPDGSEIPVSTAVRRYVSKNSYRNDLFDGEALRETQWYTPDGKDMLQTSVRFDMNTYSVERHPGSFGQILPIDRLRLFADLAGKARRVLGTKEIRGRECVGFEISASQYGDNPKAWIDRVWIDVETKLPMSIEETGRPVSSDPQKTFRSVSEAFEYAPALAADTFVPVIPPTFTEARKE